MIAVINIADLSEATDSQVAAAVLGAGSEFELEVPLPSVNHSQSYLAPALEFLHALYIGETLYTLCDSISHAWHERDVRLYDARRPPVSSRFRVRPRDAVSFAKKLHELALWFEPDDDMLLMDKTEILDEYQDTVEKLLATGGIHFPELANMYVENYRVAAEEDAEDDWNEEDSL
jgi:hypothetical protein